MPSKETGTKKSYKRELAIALVIWLMYLVETKPVEVVEVVVFPIFTFAALAFGMSWYSPNGGLLRHQSPEPPYRGRSERSSQRPSREDQQSDYRSDECDRAEARKTSSKDYPPE